MAGYLPRSARVNFAEEQVDKDGHGPEEGVILPDTHRVELLGRCRVGGALGRSSLSRLDILGLGIGHGDGDGGRGSNRLTREERGGDVNEDCETSLPR